MLLTVSSQKTDQGSGSHDFCDTGLMVPTLSHKRNFFSRR